MSRKNNRKIRARAHEFALKKDKEERAKKEKKEERKKQSKETLDIMMKLDIGGKRPSSLSSISAPVTKKMKRKGVRLRKNSMVRGVRIKDAESRKKVKEILAAEESMKDVLEMTRDS